MSIKKLIEQPGFEKISFFIPELDNLIEPINSQESHCHFGINVLNSPHRGSICFGALRNSAPDVSGDEFRVEGWGIHGNSDNWILQQSGVFANGFCFPLLNRKAEFFQLGLSDTLYKENEILFFTSSHTRTTVNTL